MTDPPPVWLLDVDGVVNAQRPGWGAAPRLAGAWSATDRYEYRIRWAPALIDRIHRLHRHKLVDLHWCTTWCPDADVLERLWAFPPLPRAVTANPVPKGAGAQALKLTAAHEVLRGGRRLIWTDDDAITDTDETVNRAVSAGRALLVRPDPVRGLQPSDLDLIETFAGCPAPVPRNPAPWM